MRYNYYKPQAENTTTNQQTTMGQDDINDSSDTENLLQKSLLYI